MNNISESINKREIKFRYWYGGKMLEVGQIDFFNESSVVHVNGELVGGTLMQYTGLKDKNGKEIYEGDIVKGFYWMDGQQFRIEAGQVKWESCQWLVSNPFNSPNLRDLHSSNDDCVEIIGNIYESSELLK